MRLTSRRFSSLAAGLFGLLFGVGLTLSLPLTAQPPPAPAVAAPYAPVAFSADSPAYRGLDANLYMQTAAEYRACCYQAYNLAAARLKESLAAGKYDPAKCAVVMDLDETVLDNAGFQTMLLKSGLGYDHRFWDMWEVKYSDAVGLVPGAKDFITGAEKLGVTVFYITNRSCTFAPATEKALRRLGIPPKSADCLKPRATDDNKTDRRQEVEARYTVLLYVGDNLRDFDERFAFPKNLGNPADAIKNRKGEVEKTRGEWGTKWIILPNPAYGEWMKAVGKGLDGLDRLVPTGK